MDMSKISLKTKLMNKIQDCYKDYKIQDQLIPLKNT